MSSRRCTFLACHPKMKDAAAAKTVPTQSNMFYLCLLLPIANDLDGRNSSELTNNLDGLNINAKDGD